MASGGPADHRVYAYSSASTHHMFPVGSHTQSLGTRHGAGTARSRRAVGKRMIITHLTMTVPNDQKRLCLHSFIGLLSLPSLISTWHWLLPPNMCPPPPLPHLHAVPAEWFNVVQILLHLITKIMMTK